MTVSIDRKLRQLHTLVETAALINSTLDAREIRKRAIEAATRLLGAEAGSLLLLDQATKELYFEVAIGSKGDKLKEIRLKLGQGIAGWVAEKGEPVIIRDAASDPRFFKDADKKTSFMTKNMVCVPVKTKEKIVGVLEAINKKSGSFDNEDMEMLSVLANQVAVAIENSNLYEKAVTDSLTGLYHHKYFELRFKEEIERAKRYEHPVSLLMIDIDHFKKINDSHGHPAGDSVLEKLALTLKKTLRQGDILARYGGEEFAVILPHTNKNNAFKAGERLRTAVEKTPFDNLSITVSIGVGCFDGKDLNFDDKKVISAADAALYRAKQNGRNRVELPA